jgi:hypothetical protein
MTIIVGGTTVSQDVSAFSNNWVATLSNNLARCGTNYTYSLSPSMPFLNMNSKIIEGYTDDLSFVNTYNFQLIIEL